MDRSPQFARFGARTAALLDQWQQQNHRPLTAPAWLDTGGSGASWPPCSSGTATLGAPHAG